jgi:hypothetical protein
MALAVGWGTLQCACLAQLFMALLGSLPSIMFICFKNCLSKTQEGIEAFMHEFVDDCAKGKEKEKGWCV